MTLRQRLLQVGAEFRHGQFDSGLHGAQWLIQFRGDLRMRQPLVKSHFDCLLLRLRQIETIGNREREQALHAEFLPLVLLATALALIAAEKITQFNGAPSMVLQLLAEINCELNLTIVLITHEMDVIRRVCDRVAVLDDGAAAQPVAERTSLEKGAAVMVCSHASRWNAEPAALAAANQATLRK